MEINIILLAVFLLFGLGNSQSFQPCDLGKYPFLNSFMIIGLFLTFFIWELDDIYSRLSRSFTARGFSSMDPTKGIRLISTRVTKLPHFLLKWRQAV